MQTQTAHPHDHATIGAPDGREALARSALALITERDLSFVEDQYRRLFSPRFQIVGMARQLCPLYARELHPGDFFAFDDKELAIRDLVQSGDRVIAHVEFSGLHRREFMGRPASGEWMHAQGITVFTFEDNQIDGAWSVLRWD